MCSGSVVKGILRFANLQKHVRIASHIDKGTQVFADYNMKPVRLIKSECSGSDVLGILGVLHRKN